MKRPPTSGSVGEVAIVGRPNVGKSALFNRLIGRQIAIVHDQPGITRDRLSAISDRGRRPFEVWDTGGIGGGTGELDLEREVRQAADAAMRQSDLILFVVDAKHGLTPIDQDLARMLRRSKAPVLLVVNKIDHPNHDDLDADFASLGFDETIPVSAAHGRGLNDLLETIDRRLPDRGANSDSLAAAAPPIGLAVVGRPNAGKSSLINAILQDDRTIVSALPGTTRDAVDIAYEREGERFVLIDTAGIRAKSKHSSSVEVFSVMRAERTIRRADLCLLVVDITGGVTSQDKKIAGLIQKSRKPCLIVLNKWDLVQPKRGGRDAIEVYTDDARERLFFLDYAPVLVASALKRENVERVFKLIGEVREAAGTHIGTGILNRLLRDALASNPPPAVANRRLKLFYAAQAKNAGGRAIEPPEFVLFVNDPDLLTEPYRRFLEGRIRSAQPYPGLPVLLRLRPRTETRATESSKEK